MRSKIVFFCLLSLASMLFITTQASLDRNIVLAVQELWPDPWVKATLLDAYLAFIVFYAWVAYREKSWISKILWLLLILGLGNFAIATYILIQVLRLPKNSSFRDFLLAKRDRS